jgi:hypothetical protein
MEKCARCAHMEDKNDQGFPEEVFYHCYDESCSCGCHARAIDAMKIASDWYHTKISREYQRKKRNRRPRRSEP